MGILATALNLFLTMLRVLILARILSSWFRPRQRTSGNGWFFALDDMVYRATEPLLAPIRNLLPQGGMGLDFSPLILLLLVQLLGGFLINVLIRMGL
jgi:YggT family protein